jgi:hypothetical protein
MGWYSLKVRKWGKIVAEQQYESCYAYFLTITEALWPPNPKVLLRAALIFLGWALPKVKLSLGSSSGSGVE